MPMTMITALLLGAEPALALITTMVVAEVEVLPMLLFVLAVVFSR